MPDCDHIARESGRLRGLHELARVAVAAFQLPSDLDFVERNFRDLLTKIAWGPYLSALQVRHRSSGFSRLRDSALRFAAEGVEVGLCFPPGKTSRLPEAFKPTSGQPVSPFNGFAALLARASTDALSLGSVNLLP